MPVDVKPESYVTALLEERAGYEEKIARKSALPEDVQRWKECLGDVNAELARLGHKDNKA